MGCCALYTSSTYWNINLSCCCEISSSKSFINWFFTLNNWNSKELFVAICISIKNSMNHFGSILFISVSGMTLLPKEFSGSNKWCWVLKFPSNYVWPLVYFQRQITVRMNPFWKWWIHDGLRCRSDSDWLIKIWLTRFCHPSYFRRKSFQMIFFFFQFFLWNEHWEVGVLNF